MFFRERTTPFAKQVEARGKYIRAKIKRRGKLARPRMIFPAGIRREYMRELKKYTDAMGQVVRRMIIPRLDGWIATHDRIINQGKDSANMDAWFDDLDDVSQAMNFELEQEYSAEEIAAIAKKIGRSVSSYNKQVLQDNIKRIVGIDIFTADPWLPEIMDAFAANNVNLIQSVSSKFFDEIKEAVFRGVTQGARHETIAADLMDRLGVAESRANGIARDQVSKLNAQTNEARQQDLGIEYYFWSGSLDERERETHLRNEGKRFRWDAGPGDDDYPEETGHPGEDPNCRCQGIPDFSTLIPGE